jgi:protease-4
VLGGLSPQVEALTQGSVESYYRRFLSLVATARHKTPEQIDAIAQGRVWDGGTARQIGLVDAFGDLDDALAYAASAAHLTTWHADYLGADQGGWQGLLQAMAGTDGPADRTRPPM